MSITAPRYVGGRQLHTEILSLRQCPRALPLAQCLFGCRHQRWCGTGRARSECRKGNVNSQLQRESGDPVARSTMHHTALCMDTLGIEPRASRMLSGCDTTTPRAPVPIAPLFPFTTTSLCPLPARCRTTRYAPPFPIPGNGYSFRRCVRQEGGARGGRVGVGGAPALVVELVWIYPLFADAPAHRALLFESRRAAQG